MTVTSTPCWDFQEFQHLIPPYGWIRDYFAYAIQCTDAPPLYHILSAAALVANAMAPEHECVVDGEPIPIHMFFLIVGSSGNRKSAAIKRALRTVRECYRTAKLDGRIWYPESCTPEGIITALADDPNRLMVLTEWSELQGGSKAGYWQHAPQFWEMLYDRSPIQRLKMNTQLRVERPSITILGASTPSLVKQNTTTRDFEAGKMARYLIGCMNKPDDKEMVNAIEHAELLDDLRVNYDRLLAPSRAVSFIPSRDAKLYKDTWQYSANWKAFVRSLPEHLIPSGLRAGDHVYRLASLYQASMDYPANFVVGDEAMAAAIQLVWTCLESVRDAFAILPMHEQIPLERVRAAVKTAGTIGILRRDLLRRTHVHGTELDRIVLTLREREEIQVRKNGNALSYHYTGA